MSLLRTALATRADVEKYGNLPVPLHLRNASTKLMKELDYGKGYKYAHNDKTIKGGNNETNAVDGVDTSGID